jgi:hypothetical protein
LDAGLGLSRDRLPPWVMYLVGRLATRPSFAAARLVCKALLCWSPATATSEQVVLGRGRRAAPFLRQLAAPPGEGDVLAIDIGGTCPPMATEAELAKRRGRRRPREACACGCQRHRGRCQRPARGSKKRRDKGDHSKSGKEAVVVVLYTLRRGAEGKLHGPINKQAWAPFAGRKAAARWAWAQATKRGFGPATTKTVQIVLDGAKSFRQNLEALFPRALCTLEVCHVVEKLLGLGHRFHPQGSEARNAQVGGWKGLVYAGRASELLGRLGRLRAQVPSRGPGTKGKRKALAKIIGHLGPRLAMRRYREWIEQDLVIASGQVEGAVRHVVGERLDCSGMRWTKGKAQALLHLRCIEVNGHGERFCAWVHQRHQEALDQRQPLKILTDQPLQGKRAA